MEKSKKKIGKFKKFLLNKKTIIITLIVSLTLGFGMWAIVGCSGNNFNDNPDIESINKQASTMLPLPMDGTSPADHTPNNNVYYAFTAMANVKSFVSRSEGSAVTNVAFISVSQAIKSNRVINNGEIYKESLSQSSFKGVGTRAYIKGNNFVVREASSVNSVDDVTWKDHANKISKDAYLELYGHLSDNITAYIMTDETILSSEYLGENNGIYSYRYNLDTVKATGKISLEMRTMAGTKSLPIFESVSLTIRMDKNWRVTETVTDCVYKVDMLGGVTCHEAVTEVFSNYGENNAIPDVEFFRSYLDAEVTEPIPEELTALDYLMNGFTDYIMGIKPLKVNISVTSVNSAIPLIVSGIAEINLNLADLSNISARVLINGGTYGTLNIPNVLIGYNSETAYIKLGELKGYGTIEEILSIANRLVPLFGGDLSALSGSLSNIDLNSLLASATVEKESDLVMVNLPISIGNVALNASLNFVENNKITFVGATLSVEGINVALTPDDTLNVPALGDGYNNITSLLNILDGTNIKFNVSIGNDISALVNFNVVDLSADIVFEDILAKYVDGTIYLNYKDIKAKFNVADIDSVMNKLAPILNGKVELPDVNALISRIDVMSLLNSAISSIAMVENENALTISTTVENIPVDIILNISTEGYTLNSINVKVENTDISVSPTTQTITAIADEDLVKYNNITSLLNILDGTNIKFNVSIGNDISALVNFNVVDLSADIVFEDILAKYVDGTIYLNYKDIKAKFNVADIDSVMNKLAPILNGKVELPDVNALISSIDVMSLLNSAISSITMVENENALTISTTVENIPVDIILNISTEGYTLNSINVKVENTDISVSPTTQTITAIADEDLIKYNNITSLLDLIDENNNISFVLSIDETEIVATLNLETLIMLVSVEGAEARIDLNSGDIYARYPGAQAKVNFNDFEHILAQITPLAEKFGGEGILEAIDFNSLASIDLNEIISSLTVTEDTNTLSISIDVNSINVKANFNTSNSNFVLDHAIVNMNGMVLRAEPFSQSLDIVFDLDEQYIDLKELVDTFAEPLTNVLTTDSLSVNFGGKFTSGNSVITIKTGDIKIADINTAPRANANLVIDIASKNEDGTVTTTTHSIRLVYLDPSLVAEGAINVYFTYDNAIDKDVLEGTFTTTKASETWDIIKEIYKSMPELQDTLRPLIVPDENGYPTLPNFDIDFLAMINAITFNNGELFGDINGSAFLKTLPQTMQAKLSTKDGKVIFKIPSLTVGDMSLDLSATLNRPVDGEITDETFAYTLDGNENDFSSINELLKTLSKTATYRSFDLSGNIGMAINTAFGDWDIANNTINVRAQLDIVDNKTFAVITIKRNPNTIVWKDYEGTSTLYYDPINDLIYVNVMYITRSYKLFVGYQYTTHNEYYKYTTAEFTADLLNNIMTILRPSSIIESAITKSTASESTSATNTSNATVENTLTKYTYNGTDKFNINLNLEPLLGDVQAVELAITHDSDYNLNKLDLTAGLVDIIKLKLNASLARPLNVYQQTVEAITAQANSGNY